MSDFDKEAERRKLREKYERDEQKRQHTQHMSDLLLKGATMTNKHCDACGDPIFRHQGQEFCPTCSMDGSDGSKPGSNGSEDTVGSTDRTDVATGPAIDDAGEHPDTAHRDGTEGVNEPATSETTPAPEASSSVHIETDSSGVASAGSDSSGADSAGSDSTRVDRSPALGSQPSPGSAAPRSATGDDDLTRTLEAARGSLARSVRRFAEAAEETDDPRRARERLAAAREAAAALGELE